MTELCYHCGQSVPDGARFTAKIKDQQQAMCCPGCMAIALAITDGGLENFYIYRSALSLRPDTANTAADRFEAYDLPELSAEFIQHIIVEDDSENSRTLHKIILNVNGITCAACAWLIEKHLSSLSGIEEVLVNISGHRATVVWHPQQIKLSQILNAFLHVGYQASPLGEQSQSLMREQENRRYLLKLGVAAIGMMQAGMLAIGLYAGAFEGISEEIKNLLRWVSLIFATPVIFYSGQSFFIKAWHNLKQVVSDLSQAVADKTTFVDKVSTVKLVMDVPISLALLLAYVASLYATITSGGEIYFESITMFVFFLLLGRYVEMRVRHRNELLGDGFSQGLPITASLLARAAEKKATHSSLSSRATGDRLNESDLAYSNLIDTEDNYSDDNTPVEVPVKTLQAGDLIRIAAGATLPCDGVVEEGASAVSEALLTGEQYPVNKRVGQTVCAGSINGENPLSIKVSAIGKKTRLSAILSLVERAQSEKPQQQALADQLARVFVLVVLLSALATGLYWWAVAPERALWIVVSVLVVACPCALSLATPAALAVASGELRKHGFLVTRSHVIETLANIDSVVFDKTGTLTEGNMTISDVHSLTDLCDDKLLRFAAALEAYSKHPLANAFKSVRVFPRASNVCQHLGSGITGTIDNRVFGIGHQAFIEKHFSLPALDAPALQFGQSSLLLANSHGAMAWIVVQDQLRSGAKAAVSALRDQLDVQLLSGDTPQVVANIAHQLSIKHWRAAVSPDEKLQHIRGLQQSGHRVLVIGDGINDVPVLSGADISVAIGDASDLARVHADSILMDGDLSAVLAARTIALQTRRIIRQNLAWAACYNLLGISFAIFGFVPPWAAAIGMSASSILVVLNALRIRGTTSPSIAWYSRWFYPRKLLVVSS